MPALLLSITGALAFAALDPRLGATLPVAVLVGCGLGVLALPTPRRGGPGAVFAAALAVRLVLLAAPAALSDDVFRYLWEGRLVAAGENPYLAGPASPRWDAFAAADPAAALLRGGVNHAALPTIYPPLALGLFAGAATLSPDPLVWRALAALADAGTAATLAGLRQDEGRSPVPAWRYALLPLPAVEAAVGGHLEAFALLALALALRAAGRGQRAAWAWASIGAGLKVLPGAVVLGLARAAGLRRGLPAAALALAAALVLPALPFAAAGPGLFSSLGTYARHWSFQGLGFPLLEAVFAGAARPVAAGLALAVVGLALAAKARPLAVARVAGAAFVLLSPTVHPWYWGWALVPALAAGGGVWAAGAAVAPLGYLVLDTRDPLSGAWAEPGWTAPVVAATLAAAALAAAARRALLPGPADPRAPVTPRF
jgi:alpha-1,6-mannosyltransferase